MSVFQKRPLIRACIAVAIVFGASGCISVLPDKSTPLDRYGLEAPTQPGATAPTSDLRLVINRPAASGALKNTRIALKRRPLQYEYFTGAEWTDRTPVLVQQMFTRAFENSGKIMAVGARSSGVAGDYALHTDIRAFEADYTNGMRRARVSFYVKLLTNPSGDVLAAKLFEVEAPIARDTSEAAVSALNEAAVEAVSQTVTWVLNAGADATSS
ncbi:MAG: ABC-type transport auxiliary lipoprotein family protein [Pseudomonadota bacterium]